MSRLSSAVSGQFFVTRPDWRSYRAGDASTIVVRIGKRHSGHRLDPDDVALDGLDTGHGLGCDACSISLACVQDRPPKLDHTISDDHVNHMPRRPALSFQLREHEVANTLEAGRRGI